MGTYNIWTHVSGWLVVSDPKIPFDTSGGELGSSSQEGMNMKKIVKRQTFQKL